MGFVKFESSLQMSELLIVLKSPKKGILIITTKGVVSTKNSKEKALNLENLVLCESLFSTKSVLNVAIF